MQLADVALAEEDLVALAGLLLRGEDEEPLAVALDESVGKIGTQLGDALRGEEATGGVEQAGARELGDDVDQARAADPGGCDIADHLQGDALVGNRDDLDGAGCRAHAAADRRGLKRRARGSGGRHEALAIAQHDLAVGADIDEESQTLVAIHPGSQHPGDDVAADVGAQVREEHRPRPRMHVDAQVGCEQVGVGRRGEDERGHTEGLGVDTEHELRHRRVAGQCDLVDG